MTNSNGKDNTKDDTGSASTDRRNFLKAAGAAGAGAVAVAGATHGKFALAPITAAQADTTSMPKLSDQKWWPSKWGADDQAGASNHITPAKVLETAKWIKDGKIYHHGHDYESSRPLFGNLVDIMAVKGRMMEAGEEISDADLRATLAKQNLNEEDIRPGDGIFFNT